VPAELEEFYRKLRPFYSGLDQLVFIDETSKDGRDALRKYACSRRNIPAIVSLPFIRGERLSILAEIEDSCLLLLVLLVVDEGHNRPLKL
jgi:hypothetical protein